MRNVDGPWLYDHISRGPRFHISSHPASPLGDVYVSEACLDRERRTPHDATMKIHQITRYADRFSRSLRERRAISTGPRENSPASAFRVRALR